ncbi:MAG: DEAD/DEAH box helicase [Anaerolineales bacterium]|nr:DEAD/DEAH box helicase [Anaerolineales bacterium]
MKFTEFNLDARLQAGIQRAGFSQPTPIQTQAIPVALAGEDIVGTAQTGTGKTAAFVLPLLHKLLQGPRRQTRALIVTPTRELADQIRETVKLLGAGTGLRSVTVYGGVGAHPQAQALRAGAEIVVACPGRLLDLAGQRAARLDKVEILVLDEADRMFDMGFLPDVRRILNLLPKERQTLLFSATFPEEVQALAEQALRNPQRVAVGISAPAHTVSHALYPVANADKSRMLLELLGQAGDNTVLVFTRTKHRAQKVARQVEQAGYRVTSLHGNRSQSQRQAALKGFRNGQFQVMVATDIAARGLDVEGISHVINYDMPDTTDAYIHRIGRTGRAQRNGDAYTLVTSDDESALRSLERVMGKPIERRRLAGFAYSATPQVQPHPADYQRSPRRSQRNRRGEGYAKRLASYR